MAALMDAELPMGDLRLTKLADMVAGSMVACTNARLCAPLHEADHQTAIGRYLYFNRDGALLAM